MIFRGALLLYILGPDTFLCVHAHFNSNSTLLLPIEFISNHLKSQQICERKIDVTLTLRYAPSTGAEFGVSVLPALGAQHLLERGLGPEFVHELLHLQLSCRVRSDDYAEAFQRRNSRISIRIECNLCG